MSGPVVIVKSGRHKAQRIVLTELSWPDMRKSSDASMGVSSFRYGELVSQLIEISIKLIYNLIIFIEAFPVILILYMPFGSD